MTSKTMNNTEKKKIITKKRPTGFVAICQCGVIVGAMDYERTERRDAGKLLGMWLHDGCTVEPRFNGTWSITVEKCRCRGETCGDGGAD